MRRYWCYVKKMTIQIFSNSERFETPRVKKNGFYDCVYLSSLLSSVSTITFERIMGLDWNLVHVVRARNERTSSSCFRNNKKFNFPTKIYEVRNTRKNLRKQNYLFQKDQQLCYWIFLQELYNINYIIYMYIKYKLFISRKYKN